MGGVDEFESWFAQAPGASCLSSIKHAAFGPFLRGLSCSSKMETNSPVATVPESLVLSTSYSNPDWDVELAQALWRECLKGPKSDLYGYVASRDVPLNLYIHVFVFTTHRLHSLIEL